MFLDATAIVAILTGAAEASDLVQRMQAAKGKIRISPLVRVRATEALVAHRQELRGGGSCSAEDMAEAQAIVGEFIVTVGAVEMHLTEGMGSAAIKALGAYGAAAGHPAGFDLGDAMAYACAKAFRIPILHVGRGFELAV